MPDPTYTNCSTDANGVHRSAHPDRIRAAIIVLERFDRQHALKEPLTERVDTFDMRAWYHKNECGTSACAGGILALHPAFQRLGLTLNYYSSPMFDGECDLDALLELFDVDANTAYDWFSRSNGAKVPQDVADKMRAYLREIGEETGTVAPR